MKKFIVFLTFFSFLTIGITNTAKAEEEQPPCRTLAIYCPDSNEGHMVIVCEEADYIAYMEIFCGASSN
jgi:hypothetical protein